MGEEKKAWYASKTVWFNALAFAVAVAAAFGYDGEVSDEVIGYVPVAVAVVNIILRLVTKKAIG